VYVNYGRKEDFELITNATGDYYTDVNGKICLVRYGHIYRGNKANNSEHFGCSAMILFSDPADVAANGTEPEDVYPNTFWLPPTGMQRGSLLIVDGDPQTPNYPSIDGVYIWPEDHIRSFLPEIPCQPVTPLP